MLGSRIQSERRLEFMLFCIAGALTVLLYCVSGFKLVVLNLFYLPVVLTAFYLGKQKAGIMAFISVVMASVIAVNNLESFAPSMSPLVIGLALITWASTMGLVAIFVGTLSEEHSRKVEELQDAYLGVVEVLTHHLKGVDPELNDRSERVAEVSERVARQMRLSDKEVDDIRIAALLQDMDNIEVTARVIQRAVGGLREGSGGQHTFHASDLVQSLGNVIRGALPLILNHTDRLCDEFADDFEGQADCPFGALIIRAVSEYDALVNGPRDHLAAEDALNFLRADIDGEHHPAVLHALDQVTSDNPAAPAERLSAVENLLRLGR